MRSCWSSKSSKVLILTLFIANGLLAQSARQSDNVVGVHDQTSGFHLPGEYIFPLQPGKRAMLTGTMGELRATHFHAGLDINTPTVGQPVFCSNDGYVYRVTMTTGGYGNVIYVRHRDGRGTLYAHLNEFTGPLGEYVRQERYRRKTSEIDLFFKPNEFPVTRGQIIAKSGNTGGSGGPHLHFELRNAQEEALNPMVLNFDEIQDHAAPVLQRVALKTLDISSRVNGQYGRFEFFTVKKGNEYWINQPIRVKGKIGIEFLGHDRQENSTFRFGINNIEVTIDEHPVFIQKIDKINFSETRNILALLDFRTMETRGYRYNKLYVDDGNKLPYYTGSSAKKGFEFHAGETPVEVKFTDFHGNASFLKLKVIYSDNEEPAGIETRTMNTDLQGKVLTVTVNHGQCPSADESQFSNTITAFSNGLPMQILPSYSQGTNSVYLLDLDKTLPDSIVSCNGKWVSNLRDRIPSGSAYRYFGQNIDIDFSANSLFDTLMLTTAHDTTSREVFSIGQRTVPLRSPIRVSLTPIRNYNMTQQLGVYRLEGNGYTFMSNNWKNGRISFNTIYLGHFAILTDSIPPTIRAVSINRSTARLRIRDDLSGISYFEANINGQWLLMTYDYKSGILFSERLDEKVALKGDFELKVVDNAGNETIYKHKIP